MFTDLLRIREYLLSEGPPENVADLRHLNDNTGRRLTNMRFDVEVDENTSWPDSVDRILDQLLMELMEVVFNGDTSLIYDPILKSFDGATKRGTWPVRVEIPQFALYREYKPKRNTYEFTFYVIPWIEWHEKTS